MTATPTVAAQVTTPSDREILITRRFNAPARLVFEASTRPEHVKRWWGPRAMPMTVCEIDLRVGGAWRYASRTPDGHEFGFHGVYEELDPPHRMVYTETFEGVPDVEARYTVTLTERDGQTELSVSILYPSREARDGHLNSGMEGGMRESHERLDELLATLGAADRELVMTRLINAPRERVFAAYTDPAQLPKWWGPNGFTTVTREIDVRPGGLWRFVMHGPDGTDYDNRIRYREIVAPERLVYSHDSDVDNDPKGFEVTVTFEAEGDRTRVTMRSLFATAAMVEMVKGFGAVELGQQTLGRLEAHVTAN
jgi:uncharacterized protein YndB with AHSA1/START domain